MKVINRDGHEIEIEYAAVKERLVSLCEPDELAGMEDELDRIAISTMDAIVHTPGITTSQLDELAAGYCANRMHANHAFDSLAGRILASSARKNIRRVLRRAGRAEAFSQKMAHIEAARPGALGRDFLAFVERHGRAIDAVIDYTRDDQHSYFAHRTLQQSYLLRTPDGVTIETPQDMWMRVACGIHCRSDGLEHALRTYDFMSRGYMTHASPTLFNAGTTFEQNASCFLVGTDDSILGIFKTLGDCALISKFAGGIGLHVSNVRAKGSAIKTINGHSDGIIPMLQVFNYTARYCNQSGRRKGSIAVYLEPWHADVLEFLELRLNTGVETSRARDLFLALWVPDEFMRRVADDRPWYLMSPDACPGLVDAHGDAFAALYELYVSEGRYVREVRARDVMKAAMISLLETGAPYFVMKCTVNARSNQSNLGTIRSSNLCAEVTEYSDASSYAVCNLASIAVNRFYDAASGTYDHAALHAVAGQLVVNLNNLIDHNFYPVPESRDSNLRHRPIGIGIQGVGDLLNVMGLEYGTEAALDTEAHIMETIYHGAVEKSTELAEAWGPYESFAGSPFSRGVLQFDMGYEGVRFSGRYDWAALKARVVRHGTRNSLLTSLMPTASTSLIFGNTEAFEICHSNVYTRSTLSGSHLVVNKNLQRALCARGLWTRAVREALMRADGSAQVPEVPEDLRAVYRTAWEVRQRAVVEHAVARAPFVDQSQSMNLFFASPDMSSLSSAIMHGWRRGLKTCIYYCRSRPAKEAARAGEYSARAPSSAGREDDAPACRMQDGCVHCSA
jgi:ribonucleoside-diphosphate reductase alpha subunit